MYSLIIPHNVSFQSNFNLEGEGNGGGGQIPLHRSPLQQTHGHTLSFLNSLDLPLYKFYNVTGIPKSQHNEGYKLNFSQIIIATNEVKVEKFQLDF